MGIPTPRDVQDRRSTHPEIVQNNYEGNVAQTSLMQRPSESSKGVTKVPPKSIKF